MREQRLGSNESIGHVTGVLRRHRGSQRGRFGLREAEMSGSIPDVCNSLYSRKQNQGIVCVHILIGLSVEKNIELDRVLPLKQEQARVPAHLAIDGSGSMHACVGVACAREECLSWA
jgi:hypothetical protein